MRLARPVVKVASLPCASPWQSSRWRGQAFSDRTESKGIPESAFTGKAIARFAAEIAAMEEVMECYRTAGDVDYGLVSLCPMSQL